MKSEDDIFFGALGSKDSRFDGKFFIGVKTTGIYCRPICPAKPHRANVEYFRDAISAEKAGYRPCLRCRPECAPFSPAWNGRSATVHRALKLISAGCLISRNEDEFANQLGVTARHLRRLFDLEIGKTPKQISDTNRLNFARKLIIETKLPVIDIAFTSGFSSLRRFNDAFKDRFHRTPSESRRRKQNDSSDSNICLTLSYRPPFDWQSLLDFYRAHALLGLEDVGSDSYERVFRLNGKIGAISVTHSSHKAELLLKISLSEIQSLYTVVQNVRQMFDLDSDPLSVTLAFSDCKIMSKLNTRYPGLRLPLGWNPYETSICAILGQLVSVKRAQKLVEELIKNYGEKIQNPFTGKTNFLFPLPATLAASSLSKVGTTQARKNSIKEFSKLVASNKICLDSAQDPQAFRKTLLEIKGIGPWTAEYICLRAIGDPDAFPASDLILKRVLKENPKLKIERFRPWQGYAAVYLWKEFANIKPKKDLNP